MAVLGELIFPTIQRRQGGDGMLFSTDFVSTGCRWRGLFPDKPCCVEMASSNSITPEIGSVRWKPPPKGTPHPSPSPPVPDLCPRRHAPGRRCPGVGSYLKVSGVMSFPMRFHSLVSVHPAWTGKSALVCNSHAVPVWQPLVKGDASSCRKGHQGPRILSGARWSGTSQKGSTRLWLDGRRRMTLIKAVPAVGVGGFR